MSSKKKQKEKTPKQHITQETYNFMTSISLLLLGDDISVILNTNNLLTANLEQKRRVVRT